MASILGLYLQPTSVGRPANIFPTFVFTALAVLAQHGAENTRFLKKVGCAANKALVLWVCRPTKFEIMQTPTHKSRLTRTMMVRLSGKQKTEPMLLGLDLCIGELAQMGRLDCRVLMRGIVLLCGL